MNISYRQSSPRLTALLAASLLITATLALAACSSSRTDLSGESTNNGGGSCAKCDSFEPGIRVLAELSLDAYESTDQTESFRLVGFVASDYIDAVDESVRLSAQLAVDDQEWGSAEPDQDSADAGSADAGSADAGSADAGAPDADFDDVGSSDAGSVDAGSPDTGSSDAGSADADAASDSLVAALSYDEQDGAFVSRTIDTSEVTPWQVLRVRVTGQLDGERVEQIFEFQPGETDGVELVEDDDPFAQARDVTLEVIEIDPNLEAPAYHYPSTDAPFGLGGTEFWQKWPDGANPTYSYNDGTEAGKKCMTASAIRFEAIMADAPEALVELEETSNWGGRFFNWNDDFSHEDSTRSARGAMLWAWRTSLIKWMSQTGDNGRCYLPTWDIVDEAARNCLRTAQSDGGEIQGCRSY